MKTHLLIPAIVILLTLACSTGEKTYTVEVIDGVRHVHNLTPLWGDEPKIKLEFAQKLGGLEGDDENYQFFRPLAAAVDHEGNIFIMDGGEGHIKKFTSDGKYISTFGSKGHGPGEFEYPMFIIIKNNEVLCSDVDGRVHKFTTEGELISTFRPSFGTFRFKQLSDSRLIMNQSGREMFKSNKPLMVKIVDFEGKEYCEFSEPVTYGEDHYKSFSANFIDLAADSDDNIFVSYSTQNRIEKYNPEGLHLFTADRILNYELNYEYVETEREIRGKKRTIGRHEFTRISNGIEIDSKGRLWSISFKKRYENDDKRKDFLEYEIFDNESVLLTKVPIPDHNFDNIQQCGDRLFFMDPYENCCVYEYRIMDLE